MALAAWLLAAALCLGPTPTAGAVSNHRPVTAPAHLAMTVNPGVPVGTGRPVYLSASATNASGAPTPVKAVTWRIVGAAKGAASITGTGTSATFTATAPGAYRIEALAGDVAARGAVLIHGPPAAVVLTPSRLTLPRDDTGGAATVTATLVDASGVRLGDFVGSVVLTDTNHQLCAYGNGGRDVLHLVQGVATDPVCNATATQGASDTLRTSDLQQGINIGVGPTTPVTGVRYGTAAVTNVAPVVNTLSYQVQQGDPPYLSAAGTTSMQLMVTSRDQAGDLWGTPPAAVHITLTGPGSLSEAGIVKNETLTTPTQGDILTVFSQVGQGGPITVTAAAPGWTGWTYTVDSYLNTKPAGLTITPDGSCTDHNGMPCTMYRINLVDTKGQPEALASDQLTVTDDAAKQSTDNVIADYYGPRRHASVLYGQYSADMASVQVDPPGQPPPRLYMQDGQAFLVVETGAAGDAPVTIRVTDALYHFTAGTTYDWQIGPLGGSWAAPSTYFATPMTPGGACPGAGSCIDGEQCTTVSTPSYPCTYSVLAGDKVPFSIRLTDPNGNPLSLADVPVLFGVGGSDPGHLPGGSEYATAWTGPTGAASTVVTAPQPLPRRANLTGPQSGFGLESWQQNNWIGMPQPPVQSGFGPEVSVVDAADYATTVRVAGPARRTVRAGQGLTLSVSVLNDKGVVIRESVPGSSDFNDDALSIRSSNPRAVSLFDSQTDRDVGFVFVPPALHGTSPLTWSLPGLRALAPGTATITVRDVSNPSRPTTTVVIRVVRR